MFGFAELGVGELLHTRSFNLVDAMSAVEVMDAKMDAGMSRRLQQVPCAEEAVRKVLEKGVRLKTYTLSTQFPFSSADQLFE